METNTPPGLALWLLVGATPFCIWVAISDMARMKIPNRAVLGLVAVYVLAGLLTFVVADWTLADWAWRWTHLVVALLVGMGLNALSLMGAGDAKFIAACAPFVALADLRLVLVIYAALVLVTWMLHRLARVTAGPILAPGWISWTSGKRFPMGLPLAATLMAYLGLAALV